MGIGLILIIITLIDLFLGFFIITQKQRASSSNSFSLLCFIAGIWTFVNYITTISNKIVWLDSTYALGIIVTSIGFFWTLQLCKTRIVSWNVFAILLISSFFIISSYKDGFITKLDDKILFGAVFDGGPGWGLYLYSIYFIFLMMCILYNLYKNYIKSNNQDEMRQLKLILIGAFVALLTTTIISFIFPLFSLFPFTGLDCVGFLIFLIFVSYAITKHYLFNIKIITAQIIIFILWVSITFHILMSHSPYQRFIETIFLFTLIILGVSFIRIIFHSIEQDEKIKKLSGELSKAYNQIKNLGQINKDSDPSF